MTKTNPFDGMDTMTMAAMLVAESLWNAEKPQIDARPDLLGNPDMTVLQTGFLLGAIRALEMAREVLATQRGAEAASPLSDGFGGEPA